MSFFARFNPVASRRARLLLAASLWTVIGCGLLAAGIHGLGHARSPVWFAALPAACLAGWLKGRLVLAPRADANSARILAAGESRCIGGAFSWSSWGIAAIMMLGGYVLRHSAIPRTWLGLLYAAIGTALVAAAQGSWRSWHHCSRGTRSPA